MKHLTVSLLVVFVVAMAPALAQTPAEKGLEIAAETDRRDQGFVDIQVDICLLYTSPSPRDQRGSRMPSSA